MNIDDLREQICTICHCMWQQGFVAANDGNLSALIDLKNNDNAKAILCTPSGISKREIQPDMLLIVDLNGNILEGKGRVSTELSMHLRCYRDRPDVGAVVHAHPPMSTSFAVANVPLDDYAMIETILNLGSVPIAPYATPGTDEVPESIAPYIQNHDAVLMRAHGAITLGADIKTAYYRMETLEQFAKITLNTRLLGGAQDLPRKQIDDLIERRTSFYHLTGRHPGYEKLS